MPFKFRKNDPGSGGSRPGAGRRPDISPEGRFEIGRYCEERYAYECQEYNLKVWLDDLIALWEASPHTAAERTDFYDKIFEIIEPSNEEISLGYWFAFTPLSLYDENANLRFSVSECLSLIRVIAEQLYGFAIEPPVDINLPRDKIAWTRNRILLEAQRLLDDPEQSEIQSVNCPLGVTIRFIKSCWDLFNDWDNGG